MIVNSISQQATSFGITLHFLPFVFTKHTNNISHRFLKPYKDSSATVQARVKTVRRCATKNFTLKLDKNSCGEPKVCAMNCNKDNFAGVHVHKHHKILKKSLKVKKPIHNKLAFNIYLFIYLLYSTLVYKIVKNNSRQFQIVLMF